MMKDEEFDWGILDERVARGVTVLSRLEPDWPHRVNLDTLDMSNMFKCVLGQIYGAYQDGLDELFPDAIDQDTSYYQGKWHGFGLPQTERKLIAQTMGLPRWTSSVIYEDLTRRWREIIIARREETTVNAAQ